MAASQDQHSDVHTPQHTHRSKRPLWVGLAINFIIFFLISVLILAPLIYFKVIPPQWSAALLGILGTAFGSIGSFVKTTLSDKDFQQAFRKWLTQHLFGDAESKDDRAARDANPAPAVQGTPQPTININVAPIFTSTNT